MKSFFEIYLMLFITLVMFFCMMLFAEEVSIHQEGIHLRNRINEIIEIENGYTDVAKNKINELLELSKRDITVTVDKIGSLAYGDKLEFTITINYKRKLPFNINDGSIQYILKGRYYNING